jgi:glycosyltransferase involved in cell wall biosynthesis
LGARFDIPAILSAFDIFVLSSSTEGLPLVVPEAMACGLPVVSTRVGGLPGVVTDGASGILVPPNDAPRLGEAIAALVRQPERRHKYAEAARRDAVVRFSLDRVVDAYEALYAPDTVGARTDERRRTIKAGAPRAHASVPLPPECAVVSRS